MEISEGSPDERVSIFISSDRLSSELWWLDSKRTMFRETPVRKSTGNYEGEGKITLATLFDVLFLLIFMFVTNTTFNVMLE